MMRQIVQQSYTTLIQTKNQQIQAIQKTVPEMITSIANFIQNCCPFLWKSTAFTEYHKRIGETQHESFMRQTIQPTHDRSYNQQQRHSQPIYKTEQTVTPLQNIRRQPQEQLLQITQPMPKSYTDCLAVDHPFYALLAPKLQLLPTIFNISTEPESKIAENNYNLKIYIKQSEDDKTNMFVYSFEFPTTYQFYQQMQNNYDLQKQFDINIDSYECQDKLDEGTKIMYLAYKKILIVSPRDFVYIRYNFKKGDEYWVIATSIPDSKIVAGKERGTIILTVTRAIERDGKLYLTVYSQVDMKMPVKASAAKVRGITEIKKYLDKCYDYVKKEANSII